MLHDVGLSRSELRSWHDGVHRALTRADFLDLFEGVEVFQERYFFDVDDAGKTERVGIIFWSGWNGTEATLKGIVKSIRTRAKQSATFRTLIAQNSLGAVVVTATEEATLAIEKAALEHPSLGFEVRGYHCPGLRHLVPKEES